MKTLSPVTINVPDADAATAPIGCGNGLLGATDINWLDPFLQSTVIPSLAAQGVGPGVLPVFLLHNFVEYISTTTNCCVLGYHNAYTTGSGIQTYGLAEYDNSGAFSGTADISALSHEVGEWQNDPSGVNPTPSWGHIGQVTGCQANLEVGDPLSGTTFKVNLNGFTYHPQQLAFFCGSTTRSRASACTAGTPTRARSRRPRRTAHRSHSAGYRRRRIPGRR